ncbi:MAG: cyclic nucleotide-binding domain-containing protein [Deltaproteobacteria bacterium]|jgi:CRP-like cAMP-binding protein
MSVQLDRLLPNASGAERDAVAASLTRQTFAAGAVVVAANADTSMLCLVESGRLTVSLEREGRTVVLPPVEPGDWVGEVDLLQPGPSTTTLTAEADTALWTLDAAGLEALMTDNPVAASALLTGLSARLAARLRTARLPTLGVGEDGAVHVEAPADEAPSEGWVTRLFGRLLGGASS